MEEFIQADPSKFNHNDFFRLLQSSTLEFRLSDQFSCLVRIRIIIEQIVFETTTLFNELIK